jgi:hypothetical protein
MKTTLYFLLVSFLIWLIPFLAGFPFFDRSGKLLVNFWLFKSVMIIVLLISSYFLLNWFYGNNLNITHSLPTFLLIGFGIAVLNIVLDFFTVVPLNKLTVPQYFIQIGWVYVLIIAMSVFVGNRQ